MPYGENNDLPESVKRVLPDSAQTIYREVFNLAVEQANDGEAADKLAWHSVEELYTKSDEGKWTEKKASTTKQVKEKYVPYSITSFEQLEAQQKEKERVYLITDLTETYLGIIENIVYSSAIQDKASEIEKLSGEFIKRLNVISSREVNAEENSNEMAFNEEIKIVELQEVISPGTFLEAEVQIIRPGWGNPSDNHFYPADVLQRDASKFIGAKMYETDHRQQEKSTRSWVSTISDILRFTTEGAPIALVRVHNMDFAQRLLNLEAEGLLDMMECSIMASALGEPDYENGDKKGILIKEFIEVKDVDWVTKAGAGGKVVSLLENKEFEMEDDINKGVQPEELVEENEDKKPTIPVAVKEKDKEIKGAEEVFLTEEEVEEALKVTNLPEISKMRISKGKYPDSTALSAAVVSEIEYVKELTGSGEVKGLGEVKIPQKPDSLFDKTAEELSEAKTQLDKAYEDISEKYM